MVAVANRELWNRQQQDAAAVNQHTCWQTEENCNAPLIIGLGLDVRTQLLKFSMNKTQCLTPGYKSVCLLCSNTKHETCHSFHFWPRNPHKLISVFISLVNSCWALVFHICIHFSFSELSLYPLLTLPVFPPLERVSLVRATCLWHCLKIRIPIKPWKVESGGRMCVCICVVVDFVFWRFMAERTGWKPQSCC